MVLTAGSSRIGGVLGLTTAVEPVVTLISNVAMLVEEELNEVLEPRELLELAVELELTVEVER